MRVVFDHCVPRGLLRHLTGHDFSTVGELGLADVDDGPLLARLSGECEAFVTVDRNLPFQQQLSSRPFATIILRARSNRLADLLPLVSQLLPALDGSKPGQVLRISAIDTATRGSHE